MVLFSILGYYTLGPPHCQAKLKNILSVVSDSNRRGVFTRQICSLIQSTTLPTTHIVTIRVGFEPTSLTTFSLAGRPLKPLEHLTITGTVGFEPTEPFSPLVFKTSVFNHSTTFPNRSRGIRTHHQTVLETAMLPDYTILLFLKTKSDTTTFSYYQLNRVSL